MDTEYEEVEDFIENLDHESVISALSDFIILCMELSIGELTSIKQILKGMTLLLKIK